MYDNLPPLHLLRTFLIVATKLSFTRAAKALHITPAAVTHQIQSLERCLGARLFHRTKRAVFLTDVGQSWLPELQEAFHRLEDATRTLRRSKDMEMLNISVAPSFASRWLLPRLDNFCLQHPNMDVRLSATTHLVDIKRGEADIAIRFGLGNYQGVVSEKLFSESAAPVCTPALRSGRHALTTVVNLRHHRLIHDVSIPEPSTWPGWSVWARAAGCDGALDTERGPRFSLAELAIEAAVNGYGVALVRLALAAAELHSGRLVQPFETVLQTSYGYYLLVSDAAASRPEAQAFREWIKAEAAAPSTEGPQARARGQRRRRPGAAVPILT